MPERPRTGRPAAPGVNSTALPSSSPRHIRRAMPPACRMPSSTTAGEVSRLP